jgi:hypothetical protein
MRLAIDVASSGVGHEDLTGLDGGAIAAKNGELPIAGFDGSRAGFLEHAHSPPLQCASRTCQQLARAKTAIKAIRGCAAARLKRSSGQPVEERSPLSA